MFCELKGRLPIAIFYRTNDHRQQVFELWDSGFRGLQLLQVRVTPAKNHNGYFPTSYSIMNGLSGSFEWSHVYGTGWFLKAITKIM